MIINDVLLHQAGLPSWIPFYYTLLEPVFDTQSLFSSIITDSNPLKAGVNQYVNRFTYYRDGDLSFGLNDNYKVQIAENLYISASWTDSIFIKIANTPLRKSKDYLYSDLGFYLFYDMIGMITGKSLDEYVDSVFYKKLGANSLCFHPLKKFSKDVIAPTEYDQIFRKQLVRGYVHDPGAAMMGGVSGHAGLFSNANDLAKFFQMLLNGGEYAGERYLDEKTVQFFTGKSGGKDNRRGLGFDKPETDVKKPGPTCPEASPESYGHSGFTGTYVWNDPVYDLVYIFLSNRVHPDPNNNKLSEMNLRTDIHQLVYKSILW